MHCLNVFAFHVQYHEMVNHLRNDVVCRVHHDHHVHHVEFHASLLVHVLFLVQLVPLLAVDVNLSYLNPIHEQADQLPVPIHIIKE